MGEPLEYDHEDHVPKRANHENYLRNELEPEVQPRVEKSALTPFRMIPEANVNNPDDDSKLTKFFNDNIDNTFILNELMNVREFPDTAQTGSIPNGYVQVSLTRSHSLFFTS